MKTKFFKGRDGWQGNSITESDANGNAWEISTHKTSAGLKCYAQEGKHENGCFSFMMFGSKRINLIQDSCTCTESNIKRIHELGLVEFNKQIEIKPEIIQPSYIIEVGQIIFTHGYEDENERVIYEIVKPGHYKTVSIDGQTFKIDERVRNFKDVYGIGTYYNEGEKKPIDEVLNLVERATIYTKQQNERKEAAQIKAQEERKRKIEEGSKIIASIPSWVKSVIIAELKKDDSDIQTDYFSSSTEETVYLSFSSHDKDIFSEMRKAASKFEPTKKYEIAEINPNPEDKYFQSSDEHREKYSGGSGYYLGESKYYGWIVNKISYQLNNPSFLETLQIAASEGRFLCDLSEVKECVNIAPIETKTGEISIIEYGKGLAVIGDTKPVKDQLKALGGMFNFRLSCGCGWVFPKSKLNDLQTLLS